MKDKKIERKPCEECGTPRAFPVGRGHFAKPRRCRWLCGACFEALRGYADRFQMNQSPPQPGEPCVYVLEAKVMRMRRVKIGWLTDAENIGLRRSALQSGSAAPIELVATMRGDRRLEAALHRVFKAHRVRGEWFKCCGPVRLFKNRVLRYSRGWSAWSARGEWWPQGDTLVVAEWQRLLDDGIVPDCPLVHPARALFDLPAWKRAAR